MAGIRDLAYADVCTSTEHDPERPCRRIKQELEFLSYSLIKINIEKNHRLERIWQAAFAGRKCQHVHSIIEYSA